METAYEVLVTVPCQWSKNGVIIIDRTKAPIKNKDELARSLQILQDRYQENCYSFVIGCKTYTEAESFQWKSKS